MSATIRTRCLRSSPRCWIGGGRPAFGARRPARWTMATLSGLHRRLGAPRVRRSIAASIATTALAATVALGQPSLTLTAAGCGADDSAAPEAQEPSDAQAPSADPRSPRPLSRGSAPCCPAASPLVCFPMCEAGGCSCSATPNGPRWSCVTDRSCEQVCRANRRRLRERRWAQNDRSIDGPVERRALHLSAGWPGGRAEKRSPRGARRR